MDSVAGARQFLIDCLVARRRPELLATLAEQIAAQAPDWDAVESLAVAERVAPLLYHSTRRHRILPDKLLDLCHQIYTETGLQNALRLNELASLLSGLSAEGIDVILLKGAALAERVYGNIALRPMCDIDLLVRKADVRQALALLQDAGYRVGGSEVAPETKLEFENEVLLQNPDRPDWVVELHWSLFDSPYYQAYLSEDILWAAAEPAVIEGSAVYVLSPEHELLHLSGHLMLHHRGAGLLWWNDVAECLHHYGSGLDWDEALSNAETLNLVKPLQSVMPVVVDVWLAPVPPDVPARVEAMVPARDEMRVFEMMTVEHRPPGRRLLADLHGIPDWGARLRFLYRNLFPSAAYMDERYGIRHPALRVAYYPYRWLLGVNDVLRSEIKDSGQQDR